MCIACLVGFIVIENNIFFSLNQQYVERMHLFPVWKECPTLAYPAHCFQTKLKIPAVLQYCISDPRCCLTAPDSVSGVIYHCKGSRRIDVCTLRLYYYNGTNEAHAVIG